MVKCGIINLLGEPEKRCAISRNVPHKCPTGVASTASCGALLIIIECFAGAGFQNAQGHKKKHHTAVS